MVTFNFQRNKSLKDCLWKKNTLQIENGIFGFIETLHKQ